MKRRIETLGYRLCWRGNWISTLWCKVWFRWYCPYPIIADYTARACVAAGKCGCENGVEYNGMPEVRG